MSQTPRYRFSKDEKLKSRKLIEQLFRESKSISVFPLKALYLTQNHFRFLQAGVAVSGRTFKRAVDRNRIKRMMREAYRLNKQELEDCLLQQNKELSLIFIYIGKECCDYKTIEKSCQTILKKMTKTLS